MTSSIAWCSRGTKIATAGLWRVDDEPEGNVIEAVGERLVLLDSAEGPITTLEVYARGDLALPRGAVGARSR